MTARILLVLAAAAAPLAAPALADAASVSLNRTCFSPGEPVVETGSGFTPNASVAETVSAVKPGDTSAVLGTLTAPLAGADALGGFTRAMQAPDLVRSADRRETMLSAFTDQGAPTAGPVVVQWTLSAWDVEVAAWSRHRADPRRSMVVDTYGWTSATGTLYAHYFRGSKRFADMRIGALAGDCGDLRKTVRQFPRKPVKAGAYTVYFSNTRILDRQDDSWVRLAVTVPRSKATAR